LPGEWITRYIKRHLPANNSAIDYALITHFHADHYGQIVPGLPLSANGKYKLAGMTQVGDAIPIRTLIDRGWPDYSYPAPITDSTMVNYRRFIDAQVAKGMKIERFRPGTADQITLRHDPKKYAGVEFRNIIGNGIVWTGSGNSTRATFPSLETLSKGDYPTENMCSLGVRFAFGKFRYFTGGDLPGTPDPGHPAWEGPESAVAEVIGHTDVNVVNHHGSMGEQSDAFIKAVESKVIIIPSWSPSHPAPDVLKRIINSRFPP
jgi:hypothetical protein